jgi:hypothetical protein
MKFELKNYHRNISTEELLSDIKIVAKKLNKNSVTIEEYSNDGKYHPHTIKNRFGSWNKALLSAGLNTNKSLDIPDNELFENIESIWIKLGRQPLYEEIRKPFSKFSIRPYHSRFGTWLNTLKAFIDFINSDLSTEEQNANTQLDYSDTNKKSSIEFRHKTKREISDRMRFRILMRDGFTCKKCGRSPIKDREVELHVDHIIPWSKGGETEGKNLETKCDKCNLGKGNAFDI